MDKIDWKRKLSSRKLWVAVAGLVGGLLLLLGADAERVDKICGLILELASIIGYLLAEGLIDAASVAGKHDEEESSDGAV